MLNIKLEDNFIPENDVERVSALHRLRLLDTPREDRFDRITSLLCKIFDVPVAAITLVDQHRVWNKSLRSGTHSQGETTRHEGVCSLTILDDELTVVENALLDPRLDGCPVVHGEMNMRFYAGAPLCTPDGYRVGAICLVDHKPRSFSNRERAVLSDFARIVQEELLRPANNKPLQFQDESGAVDGDMVTVCAWSNRVLYEGQWIPSGHYLQRHFGLRVTHGMAEDLTDDFLNDSN